MDPRERDIDTSERRRHTTEPGKSTRVRRFILRDNRNIYVGYIIYWVETPEMLGGTGRMGRTTKDWESLPNSTYSGEMKTPSQKLMAHQKQDNNSSPKTHIPLPLRSVGLRNISSMSGVQPSSSRDESRTSVPTMSLHRRSQSDPRNPTPTLSRSVTTKSQKIPGTSVMFKVDLRYEMDEIRILHLAQKKPFSYNRVLRTGTLHKVFIVCVCNF